MKPSLESTLKILAGVTALLVALSEVLNQANKYRNLSDSVKKAAEKPEVTVDAKKAE